ncbi:MAG: MlaD family protein [Nautiliaceae bacterium]
MKTELKVGLFIFLGLMSLIFMTFQIKTLESLKDRGYVIYAIVNDASGLSKKSRVKLRGVKVGVIDSMQLLDNGVKLKLLIKKGVKIPVGSEVALAQDSVLGGKYLKIIPSNSKEYLKPGDVISKFVQTPSMGDVMSNINKAVDDVRVLIKKLNTTLNQEAIENIQETLRNVKFASKKLDNILATTQKKLPKILDNTNALILSYKATGDSLTRKVPKILNKVDKLVASSNELVNTLKVKVSKLADEYIKVGENANDILERNKKPLNETIVKATEFFANGSSSFKKIDNFLGSLNRSQILVDISSSYLLSDSTYLTTANIAYLPNPTKYYILGITSRKDYLYTGPGDKSKLYINAEIGKRYNNVLLRGGIIESTGGVGMDYFANNDKVVYSTEIYDFNSENDPRGDKPHLNARVSYLYLKHIQFLAGVDNVLNTNARNFFLGVGIKFKDNDLKTLMGGGATSFLK